jgi:hypothetical protein
LARQTATLASPGSEVSGTSWRHFAADLGDRVAGVAGQHPGGQRVGQRHRAALRGQLARGGHREPAQLALGQHQEHARRRTEDLRRALGRGAGQPVEGLGGVHGQRDLSQGGQPGRRPLGLAPGPEVAQRRGHRGQELLGLERLGQVGVGALVQAQRPVGDGHGDGRHLDDRDRGRGRVGLDLPADLGAAQVGQPDIEHHEVDARQPAERLVPGGGLDHPVAGAAQPAGQQVALGLGVVGDQDRCGCLTHRPLP